VINEDKKKKTQTDHSLMNEAGVCASDVLHAVAMDDGRTIFNNNCYWIWYVKSQMVSPIPDFSEVTIFLPNVKLFIFRAHNALA
jgi:hypothetical protein